MTTTDQPAVLTIDQVQVGDALPTLRYDVTASTVVLGALAARDWRPMHHDHDFAVNRNGTQDIFLNTPNQAAWFERYLTDWSGPRGRLGRVTFRMKGSVFPGDTMVIDAQVTDVDTDDVGCGWVQTGGHAVGGRRREDDLHGPGGVALDGRRQPLESPWRPVAPVIDPPSSHRPARPRSHATLEP